MARLIACLVLVLTYLKAYSLAAVAACGAFAVTPQKVPFICGGHGELQSPSPLNAALRASDVLHCADECELAEGCVSFGYNATRERNCQLYSKPVIRQRYRYPNKHLGAKYFNRHCFKCKSACNVRNPVYSKLIGKKPDAATSFCSSYLGYPILTTSTVPTTTVTTETSTTILPDASETTSTTTTTTTTTTSMTTTTTTSTDVSTDSTSTTTTTYVYQAAAKMKRSGSAESTSAACSCFVDPSTSTVISTDVTTTTTSTTTTTGPTSTETSTDFFTITSDVTTIQSSTSLTVTSTTTTTQVVTVVDAPAICNANGLPGDNAYNYDANFNSSPAECIASCKTDGRCLSTGGYTVTDPTTGDSTYTCRYYVGPVAQTADLGPGYYTFNDKACP